MRNSTKTMTALAAGALLASAAQVGAAPIYPLPQTIGSDTGAGVIITLLPGGQETVVYDTTQPDYDLSDDTLVAVINNTGAPVSALALSGTNIFGFEGDGLNVFGYTGGNPADNSGGYAGPDNKYTVTDANTGTVDFVNPIPNGGSTFFGLEETINAANPVTPGPITPGPITPGPGPGPSTPLPAAVWPGLAAMFALGLTKLVRSRKAVQA